MANFNAKAFMDSLSEEIIEKVKACKTAEELQALADAEGLDLAAFTEDEEKDVELSLDDLEGVGGGKGFAPVALAAVMAFSTLTAASLTSCGSVGTSTSTPTAYTQTKDDKKTDSVNNKAADTKSSSKNTAEIKTDSKKNDTNEQSAKTEENTSGNNSSNSNAAADNTSDSIGIDQETAINNVLWKIGSNSTIISCTKGTSPAEGFDCWVVVAVPENSSETVTYYSGYQFCYTKDGITEITNTNTLEDSNGYIDESVAISNVREQVGSDAKIISSTKGTSPEGFKCWVIVVEPITNGNTPDRVTYYSGYQFCYKDTSTQTIGGQNPMMNFIGNYTNGRAMMTVSCIGNDQAAITIKWSGSVSDTAVWTMSGSVQNSNEGISINYSNCTKEAFSYAEDGTVIRDTVEYQGGSGSISFLFADNNAYWYDAQENASGGVSFWYSNN